jgi:two-component system sensor histidine kinase AlgZ
MVADYSNQSSLKSAAHLRSKPFVVPELCNATAISLLVLFGELLVLVMMFAGGPLSWIRLALVSLFVQWVALTSAGVLCAARKPLASLGLVNGAILAFAIVMLITLTVGLIADRLLSQNYSINGIDWIAILGQLVISGIITMLALRYFYVQQQLRVQEQSELQSRIQALQSRIRPHFLFNSMNIIASLIATDPDTAETVVEDLSELFRASLNEAGNQVPLTDELNLCERYVRIEALRLGDRLQLEWDIPEVPTSVKIPLLTLQPLLENAIYHGIQPLPEGGTIRLRLWFSSESVNVEISNPLPPDSARGESQGNQMALANIRSRLNVLYGSRADLQTSTIEDRYVTSLRYPLAQES